MNHFVPDDNPTWRREVDVQGPAHAAALEFELVFDRIPQGGTFSLTIPGQTASSTINVVNAPIPAEGVQRWQVSWPGYWDTQAVISYMAGTTPPPAGASIRLEMLIPGPPAPPIGGSLNNHELTYLTHELANIPATQKVLNMALFGQQTDEWCWAACSSMVMKYHGVVIAQCDMASYCYGGNCCETPIPTSCIMGNYYTAAEWREWAGVDHIGIVGNLTHWGFSCTQKEDATPSFAEVKAQIDANNPFIFTWSWTGGGGHAMVVKGYWEQTVLVNGASTDIQLVCINDPWGDTNATPHKGDSAWLPYSVWTTHPSLSTDLEKQAETQESAAGVSTHQDSFLWYVGSPGRFVGHTFGGYISNIVKSTSSGGGPTAALQSTADGRAKIGGNLAHRSADQLAASLLALAPQLTRLADDELDLADDADLALGLPHPVVHMRHDDLQAHEMGDDLIGLFSQVNEVIYPVLLNGAVVSAIEVARAGANWVMKSIGRRNLVTLLTAVRDQHWEAYNCRVADYFVLHLPHHYRIFVAYRDGDQINVVHAQAHAGYGFEPGAVQPLEDVIAAMLPYIKATARPAGKVG